DGEWIVVTSQGYFNASEKGAEYLSVRYGGNAYSVDEFYDVFYRPDIVTATLKGEDARGLATLSMDDAIKDPPPLVAFTSTPAGGAAAKVRVSFQVKSGGGGIGEVR